jgi:hypothetical protein
MTPEKWKKTVLEKFTGISITLTTEPEPNHCSVPCLELIIDQLFKITDIKVTWSITL